MLDDTCTRLCNIQLKEMKHSYGHYQNVVRKTLRAHKPTPSTTSLKDSLYGHQFVSGNHLRVIQSNPSLPPLTNCSCALTTDGKGRCSGRVILSKAGELVKAHTLAWLQVGRAGIGERM
jgi:hypothetical protein